MGICVLLFIYFFMRVRIFLLRIETQGTEDDWEQIVARDIGENSRYLPDRTLLIFFCESNFYLRNEKGRRRMIGSRSLLGVIGRTIGTFESTMRRGNRAEVYYWEQIAAGGYEKEKSGMIGYYVATKHLQLETLFLSQILNKIRLPFTVSRCTSITL